MKRLRPDTMVMVGSVAWAMHISTAVVAMLGGPDHFKVAFGVLAFAAVLANGWLLIKIVDVEPTIRSLQTQLYMVTGRDPRDRNIKGSQNR